MILFNSNFTPSSEQILPPRLVDIFFSYACPILWSLLSQLLLVFYRADSLCIIASQLAVVVDVVDQQLSYELVCVVVDHCTHWINSTLTFVRNDFVQIQTIMRLGACAQNEEGVKESEKVKNWWRWHSNDSNKQHTCKNQKKTKKKREQRVLVMTFTVSRVQIFAFQFPL